MILAASIGVLLLAISAGVWFTHEGYRVYAVRTGSMMPTYLPGDAVIDAPVRSRLHVGDVVTFHPVSGSVAVTTHRVHRTTASNVQTKGDANRTPDPVPVARRNVVGRVIGGVPKGGYLLYFFTQRAGIAGLMAALFALCMLWGVFIPPARVTAHSPRARARTPRRAQAGKGARVPSFPC